MLWWTIHVFLVLEGLLWHLALKCGLMEFLLTMANVKLMFSSQKVYLLVSVKFRVNQYIPAFDY